MTSVVSASAAIFHLALTGADRLDDDDLEAAGREDGRAGRGRGGQAAGVTAGRHRADENAAVRGMLLHAHAVTEDRAPGDGARGIDGEDRDGPPRGTGLGDEGATRVDFPTPGGPVIPTRWACAAAAKRARRPASPVSL